MTQALNDLHTIFTKFVTFVFDTMEISTNVSFGWICIGCLIFGVLIKSILQVPNKIHGNITVSAHNRNESFNQYYENGQGRRYMRRNYL